MDRIIPTDAPIRKNIRWDGYDYTRAAAYFVTICTHEKKCLFWFIQDNVMTLNTTGTIVQQCIATTTAHFSNIQIPRSIVMPNHVHMIIRIVDERMHRDDAPTPKPSALGTIVGSFKSAATKRLHESGFDGAVWQRGYHDHVIRDDREYAYIAGYITNNPYFWAKDSLWASP
ncbi:MAG: hypothetical protein FWF10_02915 [Clostridiales bacterium]|nr:hypothetical protein [Clostridiales bacterium]